MKCAVVSNNNGYITLCQQKAVKRPVNRAMQRDEAPPPSHLTPTLAAVGLLGSQITFRNRLLKAGQSSRGIAGFGGSYSGVLPVVGNGTRSMLLHYSSSDPRLRQLSARLTSPDNKTLAEFRRAPAASNLFMVMNY